MNIKSIPPFTESEFPGFYLIEGFSRYAANEDGEILDLKRVVIIPVYRDKRGYAYASVINDLGERVLYQRYRLLMIAMSDRPDNYDELVVNHIDNIHGNDELENLEWTTHQGNVDHAVKIGATKRNKGIYKPREVILLLKVKENEEITFPNKSKICEFLKISGKRLNKILSLGQVLFRGDYLIKLASDKTPWREVKVGEKVYNETGNIILVRDIKTGKVEEWPSYQQYAKNIGVSNDTIAWRMRSNSQRVFPELKQYKFKGDPTPWREPTPDELVGLNSYGHISAILLKDLVTNEVKRYNSQRELAKDIGISEATVTLWLSKVDRIHNDRYLIQSDCANPVWRDIPDLQEALRKESRVKRSVIVIDKDGKEHQFPSAKSAAEAFGLSPTNVNWRLKSNGNTAFRDGTRWKYF